MRMYRKFFNGNPKIRGFGIILFLTLPGLFASCSQLAQIWPQANIHKPRVKLDRVHLTDLSFKKIDLNFRIGITNPNAVTINLTGFDYDFLLNDNSFINGQQAKNLQIKAGTKSSVDIPVSLNFTQIYKAFKNLQDADSIKYQLKTRLNINLPILGVVKIPLSHHGYFPNLRLPSIALNGLRLKKLSLSGAQLDLGLQIKNPNAFSFSLMKLNYKFEVNGRSWLSGLSDHPIKIDKKGVNEIHLPIELNFTDVGMAVYRVLSGGQKLAYRFKGRAVFQTPLPAISPFAIPFDKNGKINLSK